jgi:cysteine-rich repeat protein
VTKTTFNDGCVNCVRNTNWTCTGGTSNTADSCTPLCGNVRNGLEECDDGDTDNGDGCSSTCTVEAGYSCSGAINSASVCLPICGDGKKKAGEQCDDTNVT